MNKKRKGLRKGASGMEFEDYVRKTNSIKEIETFGQLPKEKQKQGRFLVKNNEIVLKEIEKSKSSQINDKRYYFSDGIASLTFSHPVLMDINKFKRDEQQKIESFLLAEKHRLIQMKKFVLRKTKEFCFTGVFYSRNQHFITIIL